MSTNRTNHKPPKTCKRISDKRVCVWHHRSYRASRTVAIDHACVSQLKGQYCPFSLVSSGKPFQGDLRREEMLKWETVLNILNFFVLKLCNTFQDGRKVSTERSSPGARFRCTFLGQFFSRNKVSLVRSTRQAKSIPTNENDSNHPQANPYVLINEIEWKHTGPWW